MDEPAILIFIRGNKMVTKKDFIAIAEIIKEADKANEIRYAGLLARRFSGYFIKQKRDFDYDKFIEACGL